MEPDGDHPIEPPPTRWQLPPADSTDPRGLAGIGADLEPGTLVAAYRSGLFPMPVGRRRLGWWSPDPRGVLPLDGLRVSRSLRRSLRRYELRVDTAFRDVVVACADPKRTGRWINQAIIDAYTRLHQLGWTHSVEAWTPDGRLVGGLYGVAVQGLFAGESMFSWSTDASKVALVGLVQHVRDSGMELLDVQWQTDHLATLGVVEVARSRYLELLGHAVASPAAWTAARQITLRRPESGRPESGRPRSGRTGLAGSEPGLGD
jgi:leucyl/phenylalanyl-tRNA--protein transferase